MNCWDPSRRSCGDLMPACCAACTAAHISNRLEFPGLSSLTGAWTVMDVRAITDAARAQLLYLNIPGDPLHFLPLGYEMMNDVLLNTICDPEGAHWALFPQAAV